MKEIEKYCLNRLITKVGIEKGNRYEKETHIVEENISQSTLDIWTEKNVFFPEVFQYESYKCFILKFELAFGGFINPKVDLFHYTLKDVVYCKKSSQINSGNIRYFYENGMLIDKHRSSRFIQKVAYEDGSWRLRY